MPQTYVDVVEMLIPELQRRGIFWNKYSVPGGTYRENFFDKPGQAEPLRTHPAGAMIWRPESARGTATTASKDFVPDSSENMTKSAVDYSEWF